MKSISMFILGIMVALTVGCAGLVTSAPKLVADGITIYQAAKQVQGIAQSVSAAAKTSTDDQTLAEKMDNYAKWADTIAKAAAEIQAKIKDK